MMDAWFIWLALAIVSSLVIAAAWGLVKLLEENFDLRERNSELEAKEVWHTAMVNDLTLKVQSAQRGWSRTGAAVLYSTEMVPAISLLE